MIDRLLSLLAPHYCYGCGEVGSVICLHCMNDITEEPYGQCVLCRRLVVTGSLCRPCCQRTGAEWAVCAGERRGLLRTVLDEFKFERVHAAGDSLGALLDRCAPRLDDSWIVTSIPSLPSHIRSRGYDHAGLIAKRFATRRGLEYRPLLSRYDTGVQHTADKATRFRQASQAFGASNVPSRILLIDDIVTTGATVEAASRVLRKAGATHIALAVIARQPLDETPDL